MDRSVAHVHLEIDLGSDPITGQVSEDGARGRDFSGWIELVEAIEDARISPAPRTGPLGGAALGKD